MPDRVVICRYCDTETEVPTAKDPPAVCPSCGKPKAWRVRYEEWPGLTPNDRRFLRSMRIASD